MSYTSAVQVLDGTNDITSLIDWTSFSIQMTLTKEKGQCLFDILTPKAPTQPTHMPTVGDVIYVNYTINGNTQLIFGGTLVTMEAVIDGGVLVRQKITCMDWGFLFDSKVVKRNYAGMDPQDIVSDLIANFAPSGFSNLHVQRGNFLVSTIQFNYQQPTKCLESLAKQIGWDWYIDPNKDVHFYFAEGDPGSSSEISLAPFNIDDSSGNIEWGTLDMTVDITNMKNSVYVVGGTYAKYFILDPDPSASPPQLAPVDVYTSVAGTFVYPLAYPYDESTLTVTLAGVGQAIGTDQTTDPSEVEVLYNDMGAFIRFTYDPGSGSQIVVQGQARIPILANVQNAASIAQYGELDDAITDSTILSVQEAQERAVADLDMFGDPVYDVKFSTTSPLTNQLFIGQQITLNSTILGVSGKVLVIKKITVVARTPFQLEYQVEALGSDIVTFNDIMLTLLQQNLGNTSTPASTVLQVLIPIEETITVADTVTITATSGPYVWYPGSGQPSINWGFFTWHV